MTDKRILVSYGVDVDAVAGWLGSYGGEDSPNDISRGVFAGKVGSLRLLELFDRFDLTTTWFIPGHSLGSFPDEMQEVMDAGHEVGLHGYSHENPTELSREQERDILGSRWRSPSARGANGRGVTSRRGGRSARRRSSCCSMRAAHHAHDEPARRRVRHDGTDRRRVPRPRATCQRGA